MFWDLRISYFFERKVIFGETGNQFLGTERVSKLMRQYAIPCIISLLVGALYNIVDSIFVAKLSENALTAVSLAFPLQTLLIAVATGTGVGMNALLSKSLGEHNYKKANKIASNAAFLYVCSYIVFLILGFTCLLYTSPSPRDS